MSLFTITFESDEEESEESLKQQMHIQNIRSRQKPMPPNHGSQKRPIVGKPKVVNLTAILSSSESYDSSEIVQIKKPMKPNNIVPTKARPIPTNHNIKQDDSEYYDYSEDENEQIQKNNTNSQNEMQNNQGEEDEDFANLNLPPVPKSKNNLVQYYLERSSAYGIRGKRLHFQFFQNGNPILHSKLKAKKNDIVYITDGEETHIKDKNYKAVLIATNHRTSFTLREKNEYGKEIFHAAFTASENNGPRNVNVRFSNLNGKEVTFYNRKPHLTSHNMWVIDLKGRIAVKSIKNCILVDENDEEVIIELKIKDDTISVEARKDIDPISVMGFALCPILCKL